MNLKRGQSLPCPYRPASVLQTGRSAKPRFCEFECYKAVGGDLTYRTVTTSERTDVMNAFEQHAILQALPDRTRVVLNFGREFVRGEVGQ
jgi:hypothetical protein